MKVGVSKPVVLCSVMILLKRDKFNRHSFKFRKIDLLIFKYQFPNKLVFSLSSAWLQNGIPTFGDAYLD